MILKCKCKHDYQDKKYGKGNRVHNFVVNNTKAGGDYRCTVCLACRYVNKEDYRGA